MGNSVNNFNHSTVMKGPGSFVHVTSGHGEKAKGKKKAGHRRKAVHAQGNAASL